MIIYGDNIASGGGAVLSDDGIYRYSLWRDWNSHADQWRPVAVFVMLNPSTADATLDDPTIRKCRGFAAQWNYGGLVVVNLYAYRATDPKGLIKAPDPIGPENDTAIGEAFKLALDHEVKPIAAWGSFKGPGVEQRIRAVRRLADARGVILQALRLSPKSRKPEHPLYIPYNIEPVDLP